MNKNVAFLFTINTKGDKHPIAKQKKVHTWNTDDFTQEHQI